MRIESVAAASPAPPQAFLTEALKEKVLSSGIPPTQERRRLPAHPVCPLTYLEGISSATGSSISRNGILPEATSFREYN